MSNINLYIKSRAGSGSIYEAEYQSFLNYLTLNSFVLPSDTQKIKQNLLVKTLKDKGIWNKLDSFRLYATDGGVNTALADWRRLSQCVAVNSPLFITNQGFKGNGTSSYIDVNFNPDTATGIKNYKLNNSSFGCWVSELPTIGVYVQGLLGSANSRYPIGNFTEHRVNGGNCNGAVDLSGLGFKSLNKTASLNYVMINGTSQAIRTTNADSNVNSKFIDLSGFGNSQSFANVNLSMGFIGASLVTENNDFFNAINTYMNSL